MTLASIVDKAMLAVPTTWTCTYHVNEFFVLLIQWYVVVVAIWSACTPPTPIVQVLIPLESTILPENFLLRRNKDLQKEVAVVPL